MVIKELKKANGDVYFEAKRMPDNSFIHVNWIGIQTLETVIMGGNHLLAMLRQKTCPGILNSNRELIGPWDLAVNWLVYKWTPEAQALGIAHLAHVWSPGVYGQRSFQMFQQRLNDQLDIRAFDNEEVAEEWLRIKLMNAATD